MINDIFVGNKKKRSTEVGRFLSFLVRIEGMLC